MVVKLKRNFSYREHQYTTVGGGERRGLVLTIEERKSKCVCVCVCDETPKKKDPGVSKNS
jgi:hypothetical protein